MLDLHSLHSFDWDSGNLDKNWVKHKVSNTECEQVFLNQPLLLLADPKHSALEKRHYVLGRTNGARLLFISFTTRSQKVRVISARNMNKKERSIYEQTS